jgi:hypothetical protein
LDAEAKAILATLRDKEKILRGLDQGKLTIQ